MVKDIVYVILFNFNEMFNFSINNLVWKHFINKVFFFQAL